MKQLLFVCSGNTCRSPMAEACFKVLAQAHGLDGLIVKSAGTGAIKGAPASYQACEAVKEIGGDLRNFSSTPLSFELVDKSDLIIAMTAGHRAEILRRYPAAAGKVRLLLEFDNQAGANVNDPFGGGLDLYRFTLSAMMPALNRLAEKILNNEIK